MKQTSSPTAAGAAANRGETRTLAPRLGLLLMIGVSGFFIAMGSGGVGVVLLLISLPAILGGIARSPTVQIGGVVFMGIVACLLILLGTSWYGSDSGSSMMFSGLGRSMGLVCICSGVCLGGACALLAVPWSRPQDA